MSRPPPPTATPPDQAGMPSAHLPAHGPARLPARPAARLTAGAAALALTVAALAGCTATSVTSSSSSTANGSAPAPASSAAADPTAYRCTSNTAVTLLTHDSFALSDELLAAFTAATGCKVTVVKSGDAGELTNKLVLTKNSPLGDVVFGIDNAFAGRAVKAGILAPYRPVLPKGADAHALVGAGGNALTPIDFGDVCVNVDTAWFTSHQVTPPATLDDLVKPAYKGMFVTPGASTSSPGFAFLLATIGAKGDGWKDYWKALMGNGAKITSGWTDAYEVDFTAGGKGSRPIVLSYASSPPFTIPKGGSAPTTAALLDTCFRQIEYAGVLAGAKNPEGAKALVSYLLTKPVQESIPDGMYMFPVSSDAALPALWAQWAKVAPKPFTVAPEQIDANRDAWLRDWTDLAAR
ncbi:MAG TPA: thiamine ABC transporter substrate-binding protein [Dermatophilaceae bacterium]|nr:thiamine ABC transporter substrate-binding protein [Dermatophilaceae bacterium]